jgi:hypothetical protein
MVQARIARDLVVDPASRRAVKRVSGDPYIDLEREAQAMLARE